MASEPASVLLIQFARSPRVGRVKTRMMPHLSAAQACALHCDLVRWTSRRLAESALGDVELSVAGDPSHRLFGQCLALGVSRVTVQRGADLGQRMYSALRRGLQRYSRVILVGSDCPALDRAYLRRAVLALDTVPVVLGPASDGGYVLIGARRVEAQLFTGIPWGTAQVYAQTRARLRQTGLDWQALPVLSDVDRPQDLAAWETMRAGEA